MLAETSAQHWLPLNRIPGSIMAKAEFPCSTIAIKTYRHVDVARLDQIITNGSPMLTSCICSCCEYLVWLSSRDINRADAAPVQLDTSVNWTSIGGEQMQQHIKSLKEMVLLPLIYPEIFSKFHVLPPRGVIFHGKRSINMLNSADVMRAQVHQEPARRSPPVLLQTAAPSMAAESPFSCAKVQIV